MKGIGLPRGARFVAAAIGGALVMAASAAPADAQYYRRHYRPYYAPGAAVGLGIASGIVAGGLIAGAARPAPVIVEEPLDERECWIERRRVWDGYGYRRERVRVCD